MSKKKAAGPEDLAGPDSDEFWGRLRREARAQMFEDKTGATWHGVAYVDALEQAVRQNDRTTLHALLVVPPKYGLSIPAYLNVALAGALVAAAQGTTGGRRRRFTSALEDVIRLNHWQKVNFGRITSAAAVQELVTEFGWPGHTVSVRTIERIVHKKWRLDEPVVEAARELSRVPPQPPDDLS